jgi:hypothetical protein
MTEITGLTLAPKQSLTLILLDGTQVPFYMEYIDGQQGWFYSITYGNWGSTYRRMVVSGNMLRGFRNIIPFGLGCMTSDGYEPIMINDFANNRASLFLLDSTDVLAIESILNVN